VITYAYYSADGRYVQSGFSSELNEVAPEDIPSGCGVYYGAVEITDQYHDVVTNRPVSMGVQPGEFYKFDFPSKQWVPDSAEAARAARARRDALLQQSDWTDTASAPARLGQALYDQWQTYRQALRDVTAQPGYPFDIIWPIPPQ
jgi:hypothetical protein